MSYFIICIVHWQFYYKVLMCNYNCILVWRIAHQTNSAVRVITSHSDTLSPAVTSKTKGQAGCLWHCVVICKRTTRLHISLGGRLSYLVNWSLEEKVETMRAESGSLKEFSRLCIFDMTIRINLWNFYITTRIITVVLLIPWRFFSPWDEWKTGVIIRQINLIFNFKML